MPTRSRLQPTEGLHPMSDSTYQPKVYRKSGGDEQIIASGGQQTVESGGEIEIESGGTLEIESGGTLEIDSGALVRTTEGVGAAAGTNVVATEAGVGILHQTTLTMTATPLTFTDEAGQGQWDALKVYDMPAGNIAILGAVLDADITLVAPFIDAAEGDVGIGTAACDDAADALATTEQDIIPTTAIAALTTKVGKIDAISTATQLAAGVWDGTSSAKDIYLNILIDDDVAHDATAGSTVTGTLTLTWINFGDK